MSITDNNNSAAIAATTKKFSAGDFAVISAFKGRRFETGGSPERIYMKICPFYALRAIIFRS